MNTIDATPRVFCRRRFTLFRACYLFLNFALRTNTHTVDEIGTRRYDNECDRIVAYFSSLTACAA
jgi:hypothetical protein